MKKIFLLLTLLVSLTVVAQPRSTIVVDQHGGGHFRTIQQAIDSVRAFNPAGVVTILVKKGFYKEKLLIPTHCCQVHLLGEDRDHTIIAYDDHANMNKMGTFRTYSVKISGNDIRLENLTIANSAPALGQAVALHVEGDRCIFINCRFLGNQDTIFAGRENMRQLFVNCYIEGTTDFIFGPSTCWFDGCDIVCKRNSYITAASTPSYIKFGYIFNNCRIKAADSTVTAEYLGRPWRAYAMTLFMNCDLARVIRPEGWDNWKNPANEKTVRYYEFNNRGAGSDPKMRPSWVKILTRKQAAEYSVKHVLGGFDNWNPQY